MKRRNISVIIYPCSKIHKMDIFQEFYGEKELELFKTLMESPPLITSHVTNAPL